MRDSNPRLRLCRPPEAPLSYLAHEIGEKGSNPHFLVQSQVAYRLADPRAKCLSRAGTRSPALTFHSSSYLPAVGHPVRQGFLVPLGPATTGHLSWRFPASHGLLHCASPPKHHLGSRIALQRNRTSDSVLPPGRACVACQAFVGPVAPERLRATLSDRPHLSPGGGARPTRSASPPSVR